MSGMRILLRQAEDRAGDDSRVIECVEHIGAEALALEEIRRQGEVGRWHRRRIAADLDAWRLQGERAAAGKAPELDRPVHEDGTAGKGNGRSDIEIRTRFERNAAAFAERNAVVVRRQFAAIKHGAPARNIEHAARAEQQR